MEKEKFIEFLKEVITAVEHDDSMEGRIQYEWGKEFGHYNVDAFVRVGNSQGQGGCMIIDEFPKGDQ